VERRRKGEERRDATTRRQGNVFCGECAIVWRIFGIEERKWKRRRRDERIEET
jgi:hypothetical protein